MNPIHHAQSFHFVKPIVLLVGSCYLGFARVRPGRPGPNSRPLHHHAVQRQVLHLRHRRYLPGLRRRLDLASRGHGLAAAEWPPTSFTSATATTCMCRTSGAAQADQHDMEQDPRPEFPRLQMGGRRDRRLDPMGRTTSAIAIDPGLFLDPTDGKLWLIYGSYFGYIRLVQLDPKTGKRSTRTTSP